VPEFSYRHNARPLDIFAEQGKLVWGWDNKRLTQAKLITDGIQAERRMEMAA